MTEGNSIDLPWWPRQRGRSVDREPLSVEQIVAAAIRLIDRDGLDELSMRRLGQELGAGATSLYWHVRNKDELLLLVMDALAGEVNATYESARVSSWREHAATFARAIRRVVVEGHPRAALLFMRRMALGPNVLRGMDELMGALRRTGLEGEDLFHVYWAVLTYAYGSSIREAATAALGPGPGVDGDLAAILPSDRFPNVVAAAPAMLASRPDEQFEYGLERLLDGIEHDLDVRRAAGSSAPGGK